MQTAKIAGRRYFANGCTKEQAESVFNSLNSKINMVVGAANTIAGKVLYDLDEWMRKEENKKIYRFKAKHLLSEALRDFKSYESRHYRNFGDRYGLFIDYLDEIENEVMPDVDKMYWSFKMVLDKAKEPKSELCAKIEVALAVCSIAVAIYDRLVSVTKDMTGFDFDVLMRPARLTGTLHWLEELERLLCKPTEKGKVIDLTHDKTANLAAEVVMRKLTDDDVFNKVGAKALSYHPELQGSLTDEDKAVLAEAIKKCS